MMRMPSERLLRPVVTAMAGLLVLASATLLLGWLVGWTGLVHVHPTAAPVQFNTALAFLGCGVALLLAAGRGHLPARVIAGLIGLLALLTLSQYLLWWDLGLDELFFEHPIAAQTVAPGRMAPATAVGFMFAAVALILLTGNPRTGRAQAWAQAHAGGILLLLSAVPAERLLSGGMDSDTPFTAVAPPTVALFVLLAFTLLTWTAPRAPDDTALRSERQTAWASALLLVLVFLLWQTAERRDWAVRQADTAVSLAAITSDFQSKLVNRAEALWRLADRWDIYGEPTRTQWEAEARRYLQDFPSMRAILMIDPDLAIRWRVAADGSNTELLGMSLAAEPGLRRTLLDSLEQREPRLSPVMTLLSGGSGIGYAIPIFRDGRHAGFLGAVIPSEALLDLATDPLFGNFGVALMDSEGTITGALPVEHGVVGRLLQQQAVDALGQPWQVAAWPHPAYLGGAASRLPALIALFGVLTVILLSTALLQSQRELRLTSRLTGTLEQMGDAFMVVGRDWRLRFVNTRAGKLLARAPDELTGRVLWDEFPEAAGSTFHTHYERAMQGRETTRFSEYFAPLDTWFAVHAYPVDEGIAVYFRDVTAERAQSEQLRLLEAAAAQQRDALVITEAGPDGTSPVRVVYANPAFEHMTGYGQEELDPGAPWDWIAPGVPTYELPRIHDALRSGVPGRAELPAQRKDGSDYWMQLDVRPLLDGHGQVTHFVADLQDVSLRRQAEDAIRLSDERLRLVARATRDVIRDWDIVAGAIWWNDNVRTVLGHDPEAFSRDADSWVQYVHPEDREAVRSGLRAAIEGSDREWQAEYRFMHADGHTLTIRDRCFILRNDAGRPLRLLGSQLDVTLQRELEERTRRSQKMEAIGHLTGGVAHDFNNLLTVILGNVDLLQGELHDDPSLQSLASVTAAAAERASELTSRLLAFARKQPLQPRVIDVNQLLSGMDGLLRRTLTEDIDVEFIRAGGLWNTEVDPGQLETALLNLAINARDAMPEGGRLTIETANTVLDDAYAAMHDEVRPGQYVMVSVTDSGTGMPAEVIARAFEPFFTTKDVGHGSGLGLSMVYGFTKQSDGHVKIYSEPGEGTTVRMYFPRVRSNPASSVDAAAQPAIRGGREHILVVEDDALVRDHLVAQLATLGYRVTAAASGDEALEIIRRDDGIDLLFTDVVMPGGLNGRQLADTATAMRPQLKVLFTSGYTENAIVHQGRLDPDVQLLSKPYRRQELAAKLRGILDQ